MCLYVREIIEGPHLAAKAICIQNFTADSYFTATNKCNVVKIKVKERKMVDEIEGTHALYQ